MKRLPAPSGGPWVDGGPSCQIGPGPPAQAPPGLFARTTTNYRCSSTHTSFAQSAHPARGRFRRRPNTQRPWEATPGIASWFRSHELKRVGTWLTASSIPVPPCRRGPRGGLSAAIPAQCGAVRRDTGTGLPSLSLRRARSRPAWRRAEFGSLSARRTASLPAGRASG